MSKIVYQEAFVEDVMKFFANQYVPERGQEIFLERYFLDPKKEVVVFKLIVKEEHEKGE